jgi:hypothetical protein
MQHHRQFIANCLDFPFERIHRIVNNNVYVTEMLFDLLEGALGEPFASVFKPGEARKTGRYNWLIRPVQLDRHRLDEALNAAGVPVVLMGDVAHGNHALVHGVELGECLARMRGIL